MQIRSMSTEVKTVTKKVFALSFVYLVGSFASAQELSREALIGEWEFTAYAETSTPNDRVAVGVVFDFRPDGTLITKRSTGDVESRYSIEGATIRYSGQGGEQTWIVRAFEPGVSIVFENGGTLMYLERRTPNR